MIGIYILLNFLHLIQTLLCGSWNVNVTLPFVSWITLPHFGKAMWLIVHREYDMMTLNP